MIMPFRSAHWWLIALVVMTVFGFWQNFFSQMGTDNPRVNVLAHFHTWTAMAWMVLLIVQSWAIHNKHIDLHRKAGMASLLLFPLLIAGLMAIIDLSASNYAQFGPNGLSHALLFQTGIPLLAYLWLYYQALALRRDVWAHSAHLLAMPFLLWESPFSRILAQYVPYFQFEGFSIPGIIAAVQAGMLVAAILAFGVWMLDRKHRRPILVVGLLSLLQWALIEITAFEGAVFAVMGALAAIPSWANIAIGFAIGAVVSLMGWQAGAKRDPAASS